jgi:host factor-I protein
MGEYAKSPQSETPGRMEKSSQNIQDSFLNNARKEKASVTIYLLGGVRLNGRIKSFDKYSLILESNSQEHLVFKHAISTVVTARAPHPAGITAGITAGTAAGITAGTAAEIRPESVED